MSIIALLFAGGIFFHNTNLLSNHTDSMPAVPDTAFVLGYRASQGDGVAIAQLQPNAKKRLSEVEKKASMLARLKAMRQETGKKAGRTAAGSAPVKEIPFQETITPTGALVYTVPIATASDCNFAPNISLVYNSQGGNGVAGFGWEIGGLSAITIRNKDMYHDGETRAAVWQDREGAIWSLDAEPLVQNENTGSFPGYQFQTAKGRIMVKRVMSGEDIDKFNALFPNGSESIYGSGLAVAQKRVMFPVTESRNINGKSTFFYYRSSYYNNLVIREIRYGGTSENNCPGKLVFTYDNERSDVPKRYVAGSETRRDVLLKSISSYDGDSLICTYSLTHVLRDNVWQLTRIDCSRGGSSLNPLLFSYGDDESLYQQQGIAQDPASTFLDHYFDNSDYKKQFVYLRGKFLPNSFNDGIVIYPVYSTYKLTFKGLPTKWDYESEYNENQIFLVVPSIGTGVPLHPLDSIFAGVNFQAMQAVDVDGDANDELVRVNVASARSGYTDYEISVFKFEDNPWRLSSRSFTVTVKGSKKTTSLYSPTQRAFFFGDFLGNGKAQLLALSYSKNRYNASQSKQSALIDLESGTVISDEVILDASAKYPNNVIAVDLDGDGKQEILHTFSDHTDVYASDNEGHFSKVKVITGLTSAITKDEDRPVFYIDHNGDGYLDFIIPPIAQLEEKASTASRKWTLYTGNGQTFIPHTFEVTTRLKYSDFFGILFSEDGFFFTDITRDGIADMVRTREGIVSVFPGTPDGFSSTPLPVTAALDATSRSIVPQNVASVGGIASLICVDNAYVRIFNGVGTSPTKRSLNYAVDSYSRGRMNEYQEMGDPTGWVYYNDGTYTPDIQGGYAKMWAPVRLLSERTLFDCSDPEAEDVTILDSRQRVYHNASWNREGLGFCGFSATDDHVFHGPVETRPYTRTEYDPELFGVVNSVMQARESAKTDTVTFARNSWEVLHTTYGKARPRLVSSLTSDRLAGLDVLQAYAYDQYDNPTTTVTTRSTVAGDVKTEMLSVSYANNFTSSSGHYVLGAATSSTLTREGWQKRSESTLDASFRPVRTRDFAWRAAGTADSLRTLTDTRIEYDAFGNVTRKRVSTHGTGAFLETSYSYDASGRHLLGETDPLGLTTTYSGYNVFGKPAQVTDAKGRSTVYTYDIWGALARTDNPDGSWGASSTEWCTSSEPGLYKTLSTSSSGAEAASYFDALGREVLSADRRFDGQWRCVRREYDSRGLLSRVSLPYLGYAPADTAGTASLLWNSYSCDVYERNTAVSEASGRTSTTTYNQNSVTTVRDGIASTKTTDALGRTVLVHDAGGDIIYSYRPDGNPSSISVHGGVTTTFGYNAFGERCSIDDPSLGLQTDSTSWNADGSSVTTTTNVYGTTISTSDRYGRLMRVEKIGEDTTTYSYDAYGLLLCLSSTGGSSIEYTYDAFDRVASETERHAATDSLTRAYAYDSLGQLTGKSYTSSHLAVPVTESYSYAYGHNIKTEAFLPDSAAAGAGRTVTVKQLLAENEFGQPTSVDVAGVTRTYTYTQYGLPASRSIGPGRTEHYEFDAQTGNLSQRRFSRMPLPPFTETFTYDSLGRLRDVSSPVGQGGTADYDGYSNAVQIEDAASMQYTDAQHPYTLNAYTAVDTTLQRNLTVSYNVNGKPRRIEDDVWTLSISYGCNGERVATTMTDIHHVSNFRRLYYGGCLEVNRTLIRPRIWGDVPTLYLGGDYYSAPLAITGDGTPDGTTVRTIWRDYLGSVREVVDEGEGSDSSTAAAYDAWGRTCDAEDRSLSSAYASPTSLGRGFGGHEYVPWFGIYNANARLYDPLLGRFLSPDPYVQAPDFSINFNRYAWCLNNPLKYTDRNGELFLGTIITTLVQLHIAIGRSAFNHLFQNNNRHRDKYIWKDFRKTVSNAFEIDKGVFQVDRSRTIAGKLAQFGLRFLYGPENMVMGRNIAHYYNNFYVGDMEVDYYKGSTLVSRYRGNSKWGMTMGPYIAAQKILPNKDDMMLIHEYGHTIQSRIIGPLYLPIVAIPSIVGAALNGKNGHNHDNEWYEVWANQLSYTYFKNRSYQFVNTWDKNELDYPREKNGLDYYDKLTFYYYNPFAIFNDLDDEIKKPIIKSIFAPICGFM